MQRLLGKRILIVGGAGGVGRAAARAFAHEGARLSLVGRTGQTLVDTASEVGADVHTQVGDLTTAGGSDAAVNAAVEALGGVDAVFNCAGSFTWRKYTDIAASDWEHTIASNLSLPHFITQSAARHMVAAGIAGSIVHVASVHGVVGDANVVAQCAAKAGLIGLCRATAEALRPHAIRVNTISPGAIEPNSAATDNESLQRKITQAEVARIALFLVSAESNGVTGSNVDAFGITRPIVASR